MSSDRTNGKESRINRRKVITTGAGVAAGGAIAAKRSSLAWAGATYLAQDQVNLQMYGWYLPSEPVFRMIADAFTAENPNINVEIVIPADSPTEALKVEFAAQAGPDVAAMNTPSGIPWIRRGAFLSLQELVDTNEEFAANLAALTPWTLGNYTMDGQLYGVPVTAEATCIYYNEDMLTAAGVPLFADIQDDPEQWNWEKLQEYATALSSGEGDDPNRVYGIHTLGPMQSNWLNYVYSQGGEFLSEDGLTCNIGQTPAVEAIQYLYDMRYEYNIASPPDPFIEGQGVNNSETFQRGQLGITSDGEWMIAVHNGFNNGEGLPFKWNIARHPFAPATGRRTMVSHTVAMVVNQYSKHPDEAKQFAMFFAREDMQRLISEEGWGSLSAHPATYDAWLSDPAAPANRAAIPASHEDARPYPNCPVLETAEVQDALNAILHQQLWYGEGGPVPDSLMEIETATNEAIQRAIAAG